MAGQVRFGPDTQVIESENYNVDATRMTDFENSIRRYWPSLPVNALTPSYAGIRPKLKAVSGEQADFVIDGPAQLGVEGSLPSTELIPRADFKFIDSCGCVLDDVWGLESTYPMSIGIFWMHANVRQAHGRK